ncbi:hypothetical protein BH11MYX3_BH11MYX3_10230 [soil metagenome]
MHSTDHARARSPHRIEAHELGPFKGQLTSLRPQPEVDDLALPPDLYMFPDRTGSCWE